MNEEINLQIKSLVQQVIERDRRLVALEDKRREDKVKFSNLCDLYSSLWRVSSVQERRLQEMQESAGRLARQCQRLVARRSAFSTSMRRLLLRLKSLLGIAHNVNPDYDLVKTSPYFDESYYLATNPDCAEAGVDPVEHYLLYGGAEGRAPSLWFSSKSYLEENEDVRRLGLNPLVHFLKHGIKRDREHDVGCKVGSLVESVAQASGFFDKSWYVTTNSDVSAAGVDPFEHYCRFGFKEHRQPSMRFDSEYYTHENPDIAVSGVNPLVHYVSDGGAEGRLPVKNPELSTEVKIVIVSHDAELSGASLIALNVCRELVKRGCSVVVILLRDGVLRRSFEKECCTIVVDEAQNMRQVVQEIYSLGFDRVILNTTVSGAFADEFKKAGFYVVTLLHEFKGVLRDLSLIPKCKQLCDATDVIVVPDESLCRSWKQLGIEIPPKKVEVRPQGLYSRNPFVEEKRIGEARRRLRESLGVPQTSAVYLSAGAFIPRKGADLYVEAVHAISAELKGSDVYFVWCGAGPDAALMRRYVKVCGRDSVFKKHCILHDEVPPSEMPVFFAGADGFVLPSREDPFPSVVLEAMNAGLPVVAFDGATGLGDRLRCVGNDLVPRMNSQALSLALSRMVNLSAERRTCIANREMDLVATEFNFGEYVSFLLSEVGTPLPKISCIVPVCGCARFLEARLSSIARQRHPVYELYLLVSDLASENDAIIQSWLPRLNEKFQGRVHCVQSAKGASTVQQWMQGVVASRSELVWLADADDSCEEDFTARLVGFFTDPDVVLAYAQSRIVDENGACCAETCRGYTNDISRAKFRTDYVNPGLREISECLAVKNTIPALSAVVFRRTALENLQIGEIAQYGDAAAWFVCLNVVSKGRIAFCSSALNSHRVCRRGNATKPLEREESELRRIYGYVMKTFDLPQTTVSAMRHVMLEMDPTYSFEALGRRD